MRAMFVAAVASLGIGLLGLSPSLAAPAQGAPIATAAHLGHAADQAYWRSYRHRHWWRHHWHHRWWY